jgi:hypothetical protein
MAMDELRSTFWVGIGEYEVVLSKDPTSRVQLGAGPGSDDHSLPLGTFPTSANLECQVGATFAAGQQFRCDECSKEHCTGLVKEVSRRFGG